MLVVMAIDNIVGQPGGPTADLSQKYNIAYQQTSHVTVLAGNNNIIMIIKFIAIAVNRYEGQQVHIIQITSVDTQTSTTSHKQQQGLARA